MEIVEHTSNILRLKAKRGPWSGTMVLTLLVSPILFLVGLIVLLLSEKVTLNCERVEPTRTTCELTSSGLLGQNVRSIEELKGAKLRGSGSSKSLLLLADTGAIYIGKSREWSNINVNKVNDLVNNRGQAYLKAEKDYPFGGYLFGVLFMLLSAYVFIASFLVKVLISGTFDKTSGQASFKFKSILFQTKFIEENLDNIQKVEIDRRFRKEEQNFGIQLRLKSGKSIYLGAFQNRYEIETAINEFLGVNEQ
ncbi:MAG: hypothetical protein F6J93_08940 [Oscillatoria sp. SIO1A7]|nr:hypothetical protein [Oscillatoria sp. SIO1A7]